MKLVATVLASLLAAAHAAAAAPLTLNDLWSLRTITRVELSPDGRHLLFTITPPQLDGGDEMKILNVATGAIDSADLGDGIYQHRYGGDIVWTRRGDGLLFLRRDEATTSFWQWDLASKQSRRLFVHGATGTSVAVFRESPNGRRLAFVVSAASHAADEEHRKQALETSGLILGEVNGRRYAPRIPIEVWVWDRDSGERKRVWSGSRIVEMLWSPDNSRLALQGFDHDVELSSVSRADSTSASWVRIIDTDGAWSQQLSATDAFDDWISGWSPDGRSLAVDSRPIGIVARAEAGNLAFATGPRRVHRWTFDRLQQQFLKDEQPLLPEPASAHRANALRPPPDETVFHWRDEGSIYLAQQATGRTTVLARARPASPARILTPVAWNLDRISFAERAPLAAAIRESANDPPELALIDLRTGAMRTLTSFNAFMATLERPRVAPYTVTNRFGYVSENWLIKPPGYQAGRKYPLILLAYNFNNEFAVHPWMKNFAPFEYARLGACVVLANRPAYDGADGEHRRTVQEKYRFSLAVNPLASFEALVDALAADGLIDAGKVGIAGFSYGGFLTQYAITHSDKFHVAFVNDGGAYNPGIYYANGIREARYLLMSDFIFGGPPYGRGGEAMRDFLPAYRAGGLAVPVLFEGHSKPDLLDYYSDFFVTARQEGTPIEAVLYDDDHIMTDRRRQLSSISRSTDWFGYWLLGTRNPQPRDTAQYERWEKLRTRLTALQKPRTR